MTHVSMIKRFHWTLIVLAVLCLVVACGGPEKKRAKFMLKGQSNFESEHYVAARLDFKNALQIDPKYGQAYYRLGQVELKLKNFKAAFADFNKSLKYDPENTAAHLELGRLYLSARQVETAAEKADFVLEKEPDNIGAKVLKASTLLTGKEPVACITLLAPLVTEELKMPRAFIVLAGAYLQQKDTQKAGEILTTGIEANPESVLLRMVMARYQAGHKRVDQAALQLKKAIVLQPENKQLPYKLADLYWAFDRKNDASKVVAEQIASAQEKEKAYQQGAGFYIKFKDLDRAVEILQNGIAEIPESFSLRFILSDIYANTNKQDEAFDLLNQCLTLSKDPEDPQIIKTKLALAKLNLLRRNVAEAGVQVKEILQNSPKNVEARYLNGKLLLNAGHAEEAVAEFRMVVDEKPDFIDGYLMLSRAHMADTKPELAINVLVKALEVKPDAAQVHRTMARLYALKKDYVSAEESLRKMLQKDEAKNAKVYVELGDLFVYAGKYDQAEQEFKGVVEKYPKIPAGYIKLSQLYVHQKNLPAAVTALEQGYQNMPDVPILFVNLVKGYLKNDRNDDALSLCKEVVERHPDKALGYATLGQVHAGMGQYKEAEGVLEKAIELQPAWQLPYNYLAKVYLAEGKLDKAIAELETLKKTSPDNMATYLALAVLYEKNNNIEKAKQAYRELLVKKPDTWVANNNLAFLLCEHCTGKAELDEAMELAQKAVAVKPDESIILDTLGWVYFKQGDLDYAASTLEKALQKSPDSPVLNYHAAAVFHKAGRIGEARQQLAKALVGKEDFPGRIEAELMQQEIL